MGVNGKNFLLFLFVLLFYFIHNSSMTIKKVKSHSFTQGLYWIIKYSIMVI